MRYNKKGISPLIATVLVIGFTVALAAVILTWGQTFSKDIQQSTETTTKIQLICAQDVNFAINSVCIEDDAGEKSAKITIDNKGNIRIEKFMVRLYKDANTVTTGKVDSVEAFGLNQKDVHLEDLDSVSKVELVPVIIVDEKEVTCSNTIQSYGSFTDDVIGEC